MRQSRKQNSPPINRLLPTKKRGLLRFLISGVALKDCRSLVPLEETSPFFPRNPAAPAPQSLHGQLRGQDQ